MITDKNVAIDEYKKAQGYENFIPEGDEGVYEVLFLFDREDCITKNEIKEIALKYEKEEERI